MYVRRKTRFRLISAAIVLWVVLGGGEVAARWVGVNLPVWQPSSSQGLVMVGHPTRLWALKPGATPFAGATVTVNELGLRGPLPGEKTRPRVLVVGDSTWFGHGVGDDATFAAKLEVDLRAAGVDAEVINGGVPGYSTEQTRLLVDEVGWGLAPDLLLVGNLWSDNNYDSFRDADLLASARAARSPLYASHLFRLLVSAVDAARGGPEARLVTYTRHSQLPTSGGRRVPLQDYAANLDHLARGAAARGVGVAFLAPCNRDQVSGPSGRFSWDVYFEAQAAVAKNAGVPLIPMLPAMKAAPPGEALFVDPMHPSARGHAIFAATAAEALLAAGWPQAKLLATGPPFAATSLTDTGLSHGDVPPGSPQGDLFPRTR